MKSYIVILFLLAVFRSSTSQYVVQCGSSVIISSITSQCRTHVVSSEPHYYVVKASTYPQYTISRIVEPASYVVYQDYNVVDRGRFYQEVFTHKSHLEDFGAYYRINEEPPSCNRYFCEAYGNGINFIKKCSSEHCHCENGLAYLKTCEPGFVYDTRYRVCNRPRYVLGC
jgi:hypothetical protein